jgi:hypothetical protein
MDSLNRKAAVKSITDGLNEELRLGHTEHGPYPLSPPLLVKSVIIPFFVSYMRNKRNNPVYEIIVEEFSISDMPDKMHSILIRARAKALIRVNGSLNDCKCRFAIVKELAHLALYDDEEFAETHDFKLPEAKKIAQAICQSGMLDPDSNSEFALLSADYLREERVAVACAAYILIPQYMRAQCEFFEDATVFPENPDSKWLEQVAQKYQVPKRILEFMCLNWN